MDDIFSFAKIQETPNEAAANKLNKVKVQALMNRDVTFFTALGLPLEMHFSKNHPIYKTAATNGHKILWDVDFLNSLTVTDALFVYLHECAHIAYDHTNQYTSNLDPELLNAAQDFRINYDLMQLLKRTEVPAGGLYDSKYNESWTSLMIYEDLVKQNYQPPPQFSHDVDPTTPPDPNQQMANVAKAAAIAKSVGAGNSIPAEIATAIDSYYKPQINTMQLLAKYLTEIIRKGMNPLKPNKRFKDIFIASRESKGSGKIAGFLDVSGSVSDEEINVFLNEWTQAMKSKAVKEVTLGQFSTRITKIDLIKSPKDIEKLDIVGRGGTSIGPVFDWISENKPKVVLIFTDGHFGLPDTVEEYPKTNIIWCIHNNPGFSPKKGVVVHYGS
jgi:predicted metal-dependent peptidase